LDLGYCTKITDDAIAGIIAHAPKIQSLVLSGCVALTDKAVEYICKLGDNLDTLMMAHVSDLTDRAIIDLTRSCGNLRSADFACKCSRFDVELCIDARSPLVCRHLTDMAVFELAGLANLQRLSLVRVQKLTDNAVFFLAEHAMGLERLHVSYCDRLSLFAVQHLLRKLAKLQHLTATGIPAFKRKGIKRFSDPPPSVSLIVIDSRTMSLIKLVFLADL
jgi:F-box and leucine-rich repeat protein GRR1